MQTFGNTATGQTDAILDDATAFCSGFVQIVQI